MTTNGYTPEDLPEDTGAEVARDQSAIGVVLGPREWDSLKGRQEIRWEQDGREVAVGKTEGSGVMLSESGAVVEVHLDADDLHALREHGVVSWQAGESGEGPAVTVVARYG